jgi:pyridinium-3,5-biscarboxylic acid mononucleotide synthase
MTSDQVNLDLERTERIGLVEAVFSASKSVEQLREILDQAAQRNFDLLLTRLSPAQFAAISDQYSQVLDYEPVSQTAFFGEPRPLNSEDEIAVVTAGTSDVPVGLEAVRTLRFYGYDAATINDVGVAGIWRLLEQIALLKEKRVVIVVAGMDGALPSVVAGLVGGCVIAVPTSVGYGVANGGQTALHAALASCAPGLVVVNIDNGYGAACAALRIVQQHGAKRVLADSEQRLHTTNGAGVRVEKTFC